MPDLLSEQEEQELLEAALVMKNLIADLDPVEQKAKLEQVQASLALLEGIIADEDPSPELCNCNDPIHLPPLKCEFGHILDRKTGYSLVKSYIPLEFA